MLKKPNSGGAGEDPSQGAVRKRGRFRQACNRCSSTKKKCDGGVTCLNCQKLGVECVYEERSKPGPNPKKFRAISQINLVVTEPELPSSNKALGPAISASSSDSESDPTSVEICKLCKRPLDRPISSTATGVSGYLAASSIAPTLSTSSLVSSAISTSSYSSSASLNVLPSSGSGRPASLQLMEPSSFIPSKSNPEMKISSTTATALGSVPAFISAPQYLGITTIFPASVPKSETLPLPAPATVSALCEKAFAPMSTSSSALTSAALPEVMMGGNSSERSSEEPGSELDSTTASALHQFFNNLVLPELPARSIRSLLSSKFPGIKSFIEIASNIIPRNMIHHDPGITNVFVNFDNYLRLVVETHLATSTLDVNYKHLLVKNIFMTTTDGMYIAVVWLFAGLGAFLSNHESCIVYLYLCQVTMQSDDQWHSTKWVKVLMFFDCLLCLMYAATSLTNNVDYAAYLQELSQKRGVFATYGKYLLDTMATRDLSCDAWFDVCMSVSIIDLPSLHEYFDKSKASTSTPRNFIKGKPLKGKCSFDSLVQLQKHPEHSNLPIMPLLRSLKNLKYWTYFFLGDKETVFNDLSCTSRRHDFELGFKAEVSYFNSLVKDKGEDDHGILLARFLLQISINVYQHCLGRLDEAVPLSIKVAKLVIKTPQLICSPSLYLLNLVLLSVFANDALIKQHGSEAEFLEILGLRPEFMATVCTAGLRFGLPDMNTPKAIFESGLFMNVYSVYTVVCSTCKAPQPPAAPDAASFSRSASISSAAGASSPSSSSLHRHDGFLDNIFNLEGYLSIDDSLGQESRVSESAGLPITVESPSMEGIKIMPGPPGGQSKEAGASSVPEARAEAEPWGDDLADWYTNFT